MKKLFTLGLVLTFFAFGITTVKSQVTHITISQIYGGGGNTGAQYTNDFVELYNPTNASIDISNWQIAYASTTGTSWTNKTRIPAGTIIPAKKYFLIQEGAGAASPAALPTPDFVPTTTQGVINLSGTAGKVALINDTTTLSAVTAPTPVANSSTQVVGNVIDFVGFGTTTTTYEGTAGPAVAPSNTTSIFRLGDGATDTDDNKADFVAGAPSPRNSSYVLPVTLKSLTASLINSQPQLNWETSNETNFDYFGVEKSIDAKNFAAISEVASKKASNGSTYSYVDASKTLATQFYRLKLVDNDGTFKYSNVVAVNGKPSISLALYPNPVTNTIILSHPKAIAGAAVNVTSIDGRILSTATVQTGATQTSIDATKLVKGNYVVSFINNGIATTTQLVKQ